jgi:hypothetical protein
MSRSDRDPNVLINGPNLEIEPKDINMVASFRRIHDVTRDYLDYIDGTLLWDWDEEQGDVESGDEDDSDGDGDGDGGGDGDDHDDHDHDHNHGGGGGGCGGHESKSSPPPRRPRCPRNRRRWTFVELKQSGRDIILVYAVGEDGSTVNGDNMFMSGCTLMAIISFPSGQRQNYESCSHGQHPAVGTCEHCGMQLHWFNMHANSAIEWHIISISFNLDENNYHRRRAFMLPIIADRKAVVEQGYVYKGVPLGFSLNDSAQDLKRWASNRNFRFSSLNACPICGCTSESMKALLGTCVMPNQAQYERRHHAGQALTQAGADARTAARESHGVNVQVGRGAAWEAAHINRMWFAVHFDALHATLSWGRYMLDALTLEAMFTQPTQNILFRGTPRKQWTPDMRTYFKMALQEVKKKFADIGVFVDLLMINGGVFRKLIDETCRQELLKRFVPNVARHAPIGHLLGGLAKMNAILRAKRPGDHHPLATLKTGFLVPLGRELIGLWPELDLTPYIHETIEHSDEMILRYRSIGPWSAEGSEAQNKYARMVLERQARLSGRHKAADVMMSLVLRSSFSIRPFMNNDFE